MAIEVACSKLGQMDAEEFRAEINKVLRSSHPPKPNFTKYQLQDIRELKRDMDCILLTADKGVAKVIMDRPDYINKSKQDCGCFSFCMQYCWKVIFSRTEEYLTLWTSFSSFQHAYSCLKKC